MRIRRKKTYLISACIITLLLVILCGCTNQKEEVEIQVFIAASLKKPMEEIAKLYNSSHPDVTITYNVDSSGKLMTQIEEGYSCDIYFSAAKKQMDQLEKDGLIIENTRRNVLNNQLVLITCKDSLTKVTGLSDIKNASSIALAGGSVPAGRYTRQALVNMDVLSDEGDVAEISTREISEILGGVEISEQDNVSKVLTAVVEESCEVGTVYLSDTYGFEDEVRILEIVPNDLTGDVIYPIARIENTNASASQNHAADDFLNYILSDEAGDVFEKYYFDIT